MNEDSLNDGLGLVARIEKHLRQLAPHMLGRDGVLLLKEARDEIDNLRNAYYELLYAVGNKYPKETRHETALRYIQTAECCDNEPAKNDTPNV